jgi:hypothetical protein
MPLWSKFGVMSGLGTTIADLITKPPAISVNLAALGAKVNAANAATPQAPKAAKAK